MDYKSILHTTFKLVIVGVVSATIAYLFNLRDYLLVGMLGILSISLTKKDTILNGVKRYLDVLLGLLLGTIIFLTFGYVLYSLVIFLVLDRKSTRLNSSHVKISYAVFCLKKK